MAKKNYFQIIRAICILAVILIHTLYFTNISIYNYNNIIIRRIINFAVGTFIFLAGYFVHVENKKEFYKKKIKRILIPLLVWDIIYTIIYNFVEYNGIKSLILDILFSRKAVHLYYLYALLQLFILTPYLQYFLNRNKNSRIRDVIIFISPICNLIYCLIVLYLKDFKFLTLYKYTFIPWISFFTFGMMQRNDNNIKSKIEKFSAVLLILNIIEGILIFYLYGNYEISTTQLTFINSIYTLVFCILVIKHKDGIINSKILTKIGNMSYGIYFSHLLFLAIIRKIVGYLNLEYIIDVLVVYVLTILVTICGNYIYYRYKEKINLNRRLSHDRNNR